MRRPSLSLSRSHAVMCWLYLCLLRASPAWIIASLRAGVFFLPRAQTVTGLTVNSQVDNEIDQQWVALCGMAFRTYGDPLVDAGLGLNSCDDTTPAIFQPSAVRTTSQRSLPHIFL